MRCKRFIFGFLGLLLFFQGCGTLKGASKGAAEGFKEDWQALQKTDGWMRENMW